MTDASACPEWTEQQRSSGIDPLGMQNSSVKLYQSLLPGISNVTLRVRYYGLYTWLSLMYAKTIGDTNPQTWQRFVRRAEALYALVAQEGEHETGVAGALWARRKLAEPGKRVDFADDAEPGSPTRYLKQAWGAYGAAYASQLFEIGLYSRVEAHVIPVPRAPLGEELASVFGAELGALGDVFLRIMARGSVSRAELDQLAPMRPSRIRAGSKERSCYERLLFAEAVPDRAGDGDRRQTLMLALQVAQQLGRVPTAWDVRWTQYSGLAQASGAEDTSLAVHGRRWQVYHANDLSHICFEALLKCVLDHLEGTPGGMPLTQLISETVNGILAVADVRPATWAAFVDGTRLAKDASASDDPFSEFAISRRLVDAPLRDRACGAEAGWLALQLLAILHRRFRGGTVGIHAEFATFDPEGFRSISTEFRFLDAHAKTEFADTVRALIEARIVRRHLWVALRKFRYQDDYTFLIESDNGRVRLRAKDGPVWTNPRLSQAIAFLQDIHLLAEGGLSARGARTAGAA